MFYASPRVSSLDTISNFTNSILSSLFNSVAVKSETAFSTFAFPSFFFYQGFVHRHWRFTGQQGKGRDHLLFHSTTSTRSRTLRHLFATLHVRWPSCIFNRNACVYQTATRWDLPPYQITIWVIDCWCNDCLFTCWIDTRFFLQRFGINYHPCITSKPTNQVCYFLLTSLIN